MREGTMEIVCWYVEVGPLSDPERYARGMAALPWEERRSRVRSFHFEKDRLLCLGAGLLAAWALQRAGATDLAVRTLAQGKPVLAAHPDIHFNLSHSGCMAVCAVSPEEVGADVERVHPYDPGVARITFTPEERAWVENSGDPDRAFTRIWTRKESFLKYLGTGLMTPADQVCVLPGRQGEVSFAETEVEGHLMCVCHPGRARVNFARWDLDLQR